MAELDLMEVDNKEQVRQAIANYYAKMEQVRNGQPTIDPDVSKRYNESVADILEEVAKKQAEYNPNGSIEIAKMLQRAAAGEQVNLDQLKLITEPKPEQWVQWWAKKNW